MQRKLTDAYIRGLEPPAQGRIEIGDTKSAGLAFRLTARGAASWCFRYHNRTTGRDCRVTLGPYPALGLGKARDLADGFRAAVADRKDPAAERRKARAGADAATFAYLAERYMREHAMRHKKSHAADARNLQMHILPRWRSRAYASITRADVVELLEKIVADGKPTLCNRLQALISKIFAFAIDCDLVAGSPVFRLKRRGVERVRRRVLSDSELQLFWSRIGGRSGFGTSRALRLALLTGCRVGEIAGMHRGELERVQDAERAAWVLPAERTKAGRSHVVPLAPTARAIVLELLGQLDKGEQYLFPARARGDRPIAAHTLSNAIQRFGVTIHGDDDAVKSWRAERPSAHDLRRTFNSRMASLGVPKEIRDRMLNHSPGSIEAKHYNAHDYFAEKRHALAQWDAALTGILSTRPADVIAIGSARKRART